jgi:hypothetical protein
MEAFTEPIKWKINLPENLTSTIPIDLSNKFKKWL